MGWQVSSSHARCPTSLWGSGPHCCCSSTWAWRSERSAETAQRVSWDLALEWCHYRVQLQPWLHSDAWVYSLFELAVGCSKKPDCCAFECFFLTVILHLYEFDFWHEVEHGGYSMQLLVVRFVVHVISSAVGIVVPLCISVPVQLRASSGTPGISIWLPVKIIWGMMQWLQ